jgi:multiple sugar transport system permease protein
MRAMVLSALDPILWLIGVVLAYVVVGAGVVCLLVALRLRRAELIGLSLANLGFIGFLLFIGIGHGSIGLLAAALVTGGWTFALFRFRFRHRMDWQAIKYAKESVRQTTLHLILLTGSAIFLIPFAWLVVTSLKEEKEMSKFPPVWIPTQQVKQVIDGSERGLAHVPYKGQPVTVAVMQEFDTGQRQVRIVAPAGLIGTEFQCKKSDLDEIRRVAPVWKNYPDALKFLPPETNHGLTFLGNTLQVTVLSIFGTLLGSSMVAYGFARLKFPGRDALFVVLLATMMLPQAVTMMPVFLIFRWLGWIDTLKPLWVPSFFGSAFNIFLLRQFFLGIPTELEDAAKIDGCSYIGIFYRIMLPQIKPALAALTIMAFMGAWNDFRNPLIYISSPEKETLAYALQLYQTSHGGEPGLMMAASTLVMIPVLALFFFTQRYFIQGITLTGIKG